jgi:hypothetical protein
MVEFGTLIKEVRVPGGHAKAFEMKKGTFNGSRSSKEHLRFA